jgi:hypothetical protein
MHANLMLQDGEVLDPVSNNFNTLDRLPLWKAGLNGTGQVRHCLFGQQQPEYAALI